MQSFLTFLGILAAFLAVAGCLGYRNSKREQQQRTQRFREQFGQQPSRHMSPERYRSVPGYYRHHMGIPAHGAKDMRHAQADHGEPADSRMATKSTEDLHAIKTDVKTVPPAIHHIDDITWNDLDMDQVYRRLDATHSAAGEEYLYYTLRCPALTPETLPVREESITWLGAPEHEGSRLLLEELLHGLGSTGNVSLMDCLDQLDALGERRNGRHYVSILLPVVSIALMFFSVRWGMVLLIASLIYNMLTYLEEKRQIEPYIVSFRYLLRLLKAGEKIAAVPVDSCDVLSKDEEKIRKELQSFTDFRRGSFMLMSGSGTGNPLDILMDYVRMLFHLDLIKFNQMLAQVQQKREDIDALLTLIGRIDTEIAVASFRKSLAYWCVPVFCPAKEPGEANLQTGQGTQAFLQAQALFHPLLSHPVPNTIETKRPVLLTGSNASGKSTFLKSVALGALLAQTIHTVCARHYEAPYFRMYSSMALRDNMQAGDSYFMVEIKSLKRIMDAAMDAQRPVLCFIDEVLRGTNTIERIAASSEILETFAAAGTLAFAATHDIELSDLLAATYDNYHFEETLQKDPETGKEDVNFSYQLLPGRAHTRNAIRLLSAVGFDSSVTQKAQARAEAFEKTGKWK